MWFSIEGLPVVSVKNCKKLVGCSTNTKKAMLRIVDTSSRRGALPNVDSSRASLPKEGFLPVEGEAELLVQLIRDEQLELIDLQKAFDTVDHDILLKKLHIVGAGDVVVSWFASYLSNQSKQFVDVNGI